MSENLGKLVSVHGISPVFKQRALIVAVVSFVFFTTMVFGYTIRHSFVFVLLAATFLVVELFTLFGWLALTKAGFKLFENGFAYKKFVCLWNEIEHIEVKTENSSINGAKTECTIRKTDGQKIVLSNVIEDSESIFKLISEKAGTKIFS